MPWHIEENHSECPDSEPYAVVQDDNGDVMGCHETEAGAEAQLAALYASEGNDNMTDEVFYYPAHIVRAQSEIGNLFPSDGELLARYRDRYPDSDASPFFLKTEISNNSLDSYFTHMLTDSLQNYAADADLGVGVQDSHSTYKLGYGRSLFGRYDSRPGTPPGWGRAPRRGSGEASLPIPIPQIYERVLSAAHIIPGLRFGNLTYASTDDFIEAIKGGSIESISIGFTGGSEFCDICGANYWSWDCSHIAGFSYEVERQEGAITFLATVSIKNARLAEYSAVYAGATPNAMVIRKATQEAEAGRLTRKQAEFIETRYRVKLPVPARNWAGANFQRSNSMSEKTKQLSEQDTLAQIQAMAREAGAPNSLSAFDGVVWLVDELARLQPLADDGQRYRSDLIDEALTEGVRANGDDFPQETYRGMLERARIEHIKQVRDQFAAQAKRRFPGGRKTNNGEEPPAPQQQTKADHIPDAAYVA